MKLSLTLTIVNPSFQSVLSCFDDGAQFIDAWSVAKKRFKMLYRFVGGLASVFPETNQVECDVSILKFEEDEFSMNITELSLEGILHSKQFEKLTPFRLQ